MYFGLNEHEKVSNKQASDQTAELFNKTILLFSILLSLGVKGSELLHLIGSSSLNRTKYLKSIFRMKLDSVDVKVQMRLL